MRLDLRQLSLVCCAVIGFVGCTGREEQHSAEARTVFQIIRALQNYEIEHPTIRVTNLAQVFEGMGKRYPHSWHREFTKYGKYAGFTNSIYEKYIFFPSGITNRRIEGDLCMMNAQPYPGADGNLERNIVSKIGTQFYRRTLPDTSIQQMLKELQIEEPKPITMSAPPANSSAENRAGSLFEKSGRYFERASWSIGIKGLTGGRLQMATYTAVLALALLSGLWLWRRSRR